MGYRFREEPPTPEEHVALREAAGMKPRTEVAARRGLPNSTFAVTVRTTEIDELVGMGHLVGDGGCYYQLVDIAVHPDHQGRGLGTKVVEALLDHLRENAPAVGVRQPNLGRGRILRAVRFRGRPTGVEGDVRSRRRPVGLR